MMIISRFISWLGKYAKANIFSNYLSHILRSLWYLGVVIWRRTARIVTCSLSSYISTFTYIFLHNSSEFNRCKRRINSQIFYWPLASISYKWFSNISEGRSYLDIQQIHLKFPTNKVKRKRTSNSALPVAVLVHFCRPFIIFWIYLAMRIELFRQFYFALNPKKKKGFVWWTTTSSKSQRNKSKCVTVWGRVLSKLSVHCTLHFLPYWSFRSPFYNNWRLFLQYTWALHPSHHGTHNHTPFFLFLLLSFQYALFTKF